MKNSTFRTTDTGEVSRWNPKLARWDVLTSSALSAVEKAPVAAMSVQNSSALVPYGYSGGWLHQILEAHPGDWQRNITARGPREVTAFSAVYTCISLIAGDISKLRIKLVEQVDRIWREVIPPDGNAHRPVLVKPNDYQTRIQFLMQWVSSKLLHGNAYALKRRDERGIVTALYILDPCRVTPYVAENGAIFYVIKRDPLSTVMSDDYAVTASEIIHDTMITLFHPLVGVSPIYACATAAMQGMQIQSDSEEHFRNRSRNTGILSIPTGGLTDPQLDAMKARWDANYGPGGKGGTAVLQNGMTFSAMRMSAVDSQMIELLRWTVEDVARCFHVPLHMLGVAGSDPSYNNIGAKNQSYYSQALQILIECIELLLDEGLGLIQAGYGAELDLKALVRMDPEARMRVAKEGVSGSILKINEARADEDYSEVDGGDLIWMQQQNYSLQALAQRDKKADPFATTTPAVTPVSATTEPDEDEETRERAAHDFLSKELADVEYA